MSIPNFVRDYIEQAKLLIAKKNIRDVIFSNGSYQICVYDSQEKTVFWPFIQLDNQSNVGDAFCSCPHSEVEGGCLHLAAAYLTIFKNNDNKPLAKRFYHSFFHQLFMMLSLRIGVDFKSLKKINEYTFFYTSKTNREIFRISLENKAAKQKFKEILTVPVLNSDSTSLKYSHIQEEELVLWKNKKASKETNYELSFWSDLAKWVYFLQEQNYPYVIKFEDGDIKPPRKVFVNFEGFFSLNCYISESSLKYIIPSFKTVNSTIKIVEEVEKRILEIIFHEDKKAFEIVSKKIGTKQENKNGYSIGEWDYIKNVGFYKKSSDPIADKKWIQESEVSFYLSNNLQTFQKFIKNYDFHPFGIEPEYKLFFDHNNNLHIQMYIFELSSFLENNNIFFCPWLFLKDKGFYLLKDPMFSNLETVINKKDISSFVHEHRLWLHQFDGFYTNYGLLPTQFKYQLTDDNSLEFFSKINLPQSSDKLIDFEDWLYVEGNGFYLKKESKSSFPIRPGLKIEKDEIPNFIDTHFDELDSIKGFFAEKSPIKNAKLNIYEKQNQVIIDPVIEFNIGYENLKILFFEKYVYVEQEGFSLIPIHKNIFQRYWKKTTIQEDKIPYFLNYELDHLKPDLAYLDKKLNKPSKLQLRIKKIRKEVKKGKIAWLVDLAYRSELGEVSVLKLYEYMQENRKNAYTNAGFLNLTDARYKWLLQLNKKKVNIRKKYIRLNTLEWIRICIYEKIKVPKGTSKDAQIARKLLKETELTETDQIIDLSYLKSTLWPYQEIGVKWLWSLYSYGLSGILCDDMGLGKTHQAMALLSAVLFLDNDRVNKYLVVCPTSVIFHWENLFKKYLPEIRVLIYYGMERSLDNFESKFDLILTSYGTLRASEAKLKQFSFEFVIFDELQVAKNSRSQTHKALKAIKSNVRIGLTGTPIENTLKELKALFDLILPSYMPADSEFRDYFLNPIEKNQDMEKKHLLANLIKPFILRRKKKDVLLDLPEKIEELAYCTLSDEQKELYQMHLKKEKQEIVKKLKDEESPIPFIHIFALFTKLKQICNHPALFYQDSLNYQKYHSGKWDLFTELLHEARDSKQKIVIFSQYLEMIEIIERYLKKKNISYALIKGSTKKRHLQVQKFQNDPNCEVFVASLLAAGVGIDLTAGSVVIHYDRWWNPAKENQATDRVHRIGQNRGVQVFKLITKGTIEEHIHALIEKKRGLIEDIITEDETEQIKRLTKKELLEVLEKTKFSD